MKQIDKANCDHNGVIRLGENCEVECQSGYANSIMNTLVEKDGKSGKRLASSTEAFLGTDKTIKLTCQEDSNFDEYGLFKHNTYDSQSRTCQLLDIDIFLFTNYESITANDESKLQNDIAYLTQHQSVDWNQNYKYEELISRTRIETLIHQKFLMMGSTGLQLMIAHVFDNFKDDIDFSYANSEGKNYLHLLAEIGGMDEILKIFEMKLDSSIIDINLRSTVEQRTPLMSAASECKRDSLGRILKLYGSQIDIDQQDANGNTVLHLASKYCDEYNFIPLIVEHYPDSDILNDNGESPLYLALTNWHELFTMNDLISFGADVNFIYAPTGKSLVEIATENDWNTELNILIQSEKVKSELVAEALLNVGLTHSTGLKLGEAWLNIQIDTLPQAASKGDTATILAYIAKGEPCSKQNNLDVFPLYRMVFLFLSLMNIHRVIGWASDFNSLRRWT